jgi:hypothetical protein
VFLNLVLCFGGGEEVEVCEQDEVKVVRQETFNVIRLFWFESKWGIHCALVFKYT